MKTHFANIPPAIIAMEACSGAHHFARILRDQGHDVRLLPAQHVKPFRRGNKNDFNDAMAIAEACQRPDIRCVAIKTARQVELQAVDRMRDRCVSDRTGVINQIRGLLSEHGIVFAKGVSTFRKAIPRILENPDNLLGDDYRGWIQRGYETVVRLSEDVDFFNKQLKLRAADDEDCRLIDTVPGIGVVSSIAMVNHIVDPNVFRRGRDVSASIGIVPGENSTGGRHVPTGITKRGNKRLRYLLIHGARSVARHADKKDDALSVWFCQLRDRRGYHKAVVALANKMARICWAILKTKQPYQPRRLKVEQA